MSAATIFHALHAPGELLILANAWDPGSARLIEHLGARAVATTSSGVAWARAYPDGDALPVEVLIATVRDIARVVSVPLTVDVEGGYADDPATVAATVQRVAEAGAVGINIEDGDGPPERLAEKIAAIRRAVGTGVFINARIDVHLKGLGPPATRTAELAARMARYADAGADGIFIPGLTDRDRIAAAVETAGTLPLNLMALPQLPDAAELRALGVRRLSAGGAVASAAIAAAAGRAATFLGDGDSSALFADASPEWTYARMNALMRG